jgi:hypothetical protein
MCKKNDHSPGADESGGQLLVVSHESDGRREVW